MSGAEAKNYIVLVSYLVPVYDRAFISYFRAANEFKFVSAVAAVVEPVGVKRVGTP